MDFRFFFFMLIVIVFIHIIFDLVLVIYSTGRKRWLACGIFASLLAPVVIFFLDLVTRDLIWLSWIFMWSMAGACFGEIALLIWASAALWKMSEDGGIVFRLVCLVIQVGIVLLCFIPLMMGLFFGAYGVEEVRSMEKTTLKTVTFGDSGYEMTIWRTGEISGNPGFSFGDPHCEIDFKKGEETISNVQRVYWGEQAYSGNFHVHWFKDIVRVVVTWRQEIKAIYDFYFDGTIEETIYHPGGERIVRNLRGFRGLAQSFECTG